MFRFFRRYQKSIIVVGGVILMFVFLVGDYIGRGGGNGPGAGNQISPNATFATWKGGKLTHAEFEAEYHKRQILHAFLQNVYRMGENQASRGAEIPTLTVQPIGFLNDREGRSADLVRREVLLDKILADQARQRGMGVSREALETYIAKLGFSELSSSDLRDALSSIRATVSSDYILAALEDAFLAHMMRGIYGTSSAGLLAAEMPLDRWRAWRQVNDLVAVEAAALKVDDFAAEVPEPTEQQLRALYDEFKEVVPVPHQVGGVRLPNPDPAFAIPRKVTLQYLQADFDGAIEKLKAEITDEEVKAYYEENKGLFRKASPLDLFGPLPGMGEFEGAEDATNDGTAPADPAADTPPAEESAPAGESDQPASETPAPAESTPGSESPAGEPPVAEPPVTEPPVTGEPAGEAPPADEPAADPQAVRGAVGEVRFVSYQPEGGEPTEPDGSQSPATEEPTAEPPAETEAPAEAGETPAEGEPPMESELAPAEGEDADAAGQEPAAGETVDGTTPGEQEPEAEFSPLEEVAEDIRGFIARSRASEKLDPALDAAMERMQIAAREYRRQMLELPEDAPRPAPPAELANLSALAAESNLVYEETKPLDIFELSETEIGSAMDLDSPVMQNGRLERGKFVYEVVFEDSTTNLYRPFKPMSMSTGDRYIVMKIADTPRRVPPFDEAKSAVREAWIHREAVKLAQQRAEEFAAKATEAGQSLKEFFAGDEQVEVTETPAFSWFTQGGAASPEEGRGYRMSQPFGVTNVGRDFMETVFDLRGNEVKSALNHDKTIAYVVRVASEIETEESLRSTFLANANAWEGRLPFRQATMQDRQYEISRMLEEELDIEAPGLDALHKLRDRDE